MPNNRQLLEGHYTHLRILELRLNPVRGNFDAAHLREINRRIFQDLSNLGFDDVTPSIYRAETPAGKDWIKRRKLETVEITASVAYSPMDNNAKKQLDDILRKIKPKELSKLNINEFIKSIGNLYVHLDYSHPFNDGNSRTLREFTRQLAQVSGYQLDWERFSKEPVGRDLLYIARDLSVNELALPYIQNANNKRDVIFSMDILEGNRKLRAQYRNDPAAVAHGLESARNKIADMLARGIEIESPKIIDAPNRKSEIEPKRNNSLDKER